MEFGFLRRWRAVTVLAIGTLVVGTALPGSVAAEGPDDEIPLAKVPANVKEAASKALPGAKWTGATKWDEGGKTIYELEGEDATKTYVWVDVTSDAKINEVGSQVGFAKVPSVATAALKAKMRRFKATAVYEARLDGKVIRYDFEGKRPRDKEDITVSVSPDGKTVEIDEG